ncbi:MAG: phosphodiesterase [Burkholderiaceae bacterium]|nr:phosphodiesterase [Burkholderiaceae bacterium]MBP7658834.1 phosphodiesterase [Burkholderiaceae bacterium]
MTLIAQLSDPHIREPGRIAYGRVDTADYLRRAVASLMALPQQPDAVLITGDLVDFGRRQEYEHLASLLAPIRVPLYLLPGNHDDPAMMRQCFPEHAYLQQPMADGFMQYCARIGPLRLISLDTTVAGQSHGALCARRLDWLEQALAACTGEPVIVAMHHPPFTTLIGHMDQIGLLSGIDELRSLIARHPNVERIVCGHLHRAIDVRFAGTLASTSPAPAHQVCLDLSPQAASQFRMEPPGFRLHAYTPQTGVVTHLAAIGDHQGPYPFHEPGGALID